MLDIAHRPPKNWRPERKHEYFDWAERVVEGCRGVNPALEARFDEVLSEARDSLGEAHDSHIDS